MYILICGRGVPTSKYPRVGVFEFDQAKALAKYSNYKIVYMSVDARSFRNKRKFGLEVEEISSNFKIYNLNVPLSGLPEKLFRNILEYLTERLYKEILKNEGEPLLANVHFLKNSCSYLFLKEKYKIPFIVTEHYSEINKKELSPYIKMLGNKVYTAADSIIAVSEELAENIQANFNKKSSVIGNLYDEEVFYYNNTNNEMKPTIVSVGNLTKNKNMDLLIKAFHEFYKNNSNYSLVIFGDGPERKNLEILINELDLTDKVLLKGQQSRTSIREALEVCSFFSLLSKKETFGVAYIEALAVGIPVLATNCGAVSTFINAENGMVVNMNNFTGIVDAMKFLSENRFSFNREGISKEIRLKYGNERIVERLIEEYSKIIQKRRGEYE